MEVEFLSKLNYKLMILFVCKANVWRSQIAEWIAKNLGLKAISCAAVEARKEKYNYKPDKQITQILKNKYNIDISNQKIKYPNDIKKLLNEINEAVFLFEPKDIKQIDKEVLIEGYSLWSYLEKKWKKITIYPIDDPADKNRNFKEKVIDQIYFFIKNKYEKHFVNWTK